MKRIRFISVFILSCLYCFCLPISAFALEDNQISNFEEMKVWFEQHTNQAGEINLTSDIIIDEMLYYTNRCPVTINTNGYTIYIQDRFIVEIYDLNTSLTINGPANTNGLLHVLKGGYCEISNTNVYASENGIAIIQDEESIFINNGINVTGDIQYATHPLIISSQFYPTTMLPYVTLKKDEKLSVQNFPDYDSVKINYQGKLINYLKFPLIWNINEYENPKPYQFYTYHAQYQIDSIEIGNNTFQKNDIKNFLSPKAYVISTTGGHAITNVEKKWSRYQQQYFYNIYIKSQDVPDTITLFSRSSPDDAWEAQECASSGPMGDQNYLLSIFYEDSNPYIAFYVEASINGEKYNSNVAIMDNEVLTFDDIEGGRGGGIDITPDNNMQDGSSDIPSNTPNDNDQDNVDDNTQNSGGDNVQDNVDDSLIDNIPSLPTDKPIDNGQDTLTETPSSNTTPTIEIQYQQPSLTPRVSDILSSDKTKPQMIRENNASSRQDNSTPQKATQTAEKTTQTAEKATQITSSHHTYIYQIIIGFLSLIVIYVLTNIIYKKYLQKTH